MDHDHNERSGCFYGVQTVVIHELRPIHFAGKGALRGERSMLRERRMEISFVGHLRGLVAQKRVKNAVAEKMLLTDYPHYVRSSVESKSKV